MTTYILDTYIFTEIYVYIHTYILFFLLGLKSCVGYYEVGKRPCGVTGFRQIRS